MSCLKLNSFTAVWIKTVIWPPLKHTVQSSCNTVWVCVMCSLRVFASLVKRWKQKPERGVSHVLWIIASHAAEERRRMQKSKDCMQSTQHTIKSVTSPLARVWGAQWHISALFYSPHFTGGAISFQSSFVLWPTCLHKPALCQSQTCWGERMQNVRLVSTTCSLWDRPVSLWSLSLSNLPFIFKQPTSAYLCGGK